MKEFDQFTRAYVFCALWSSNDESDEQGGVPLENNYSREDIAPESQAQIMADCAKFQADNQKDIEMGPDTADCNSHQLAGHDFWLTRNHHGAGFWDGDWPVSGERLTKASHAFGECHLHVDDDKKLHLFSG